MDDVVAITKLIHEYAFRLDSGDLDGVAALFTDAELRSTQSDRVLRGAAEARTMYDRVRIFADGTPQTLHQLSNVTVDLDADGDHASARSYFAVLHVTPQGLHPILAGEYRDRFVRADGAWRFAERCIDPKLRGDLSSHMQL